MKGDLITVDYVGKFDDGTVFDTSMEWVANRAGTKNPRRLYEPMEFRAGAGEMISGFDEAVIGMETGQTKTITLPPDKAYGSRDPDKVKKFQLIQFQRSGVEPKIGQRFTINDKPGTVTGILGGVVEVDFNHPMAGKTLHFEITLRKILRNPEKVQI